MSNLSDAVPNVTDPYWIGITMGIPGHERHFHGPDPLLSEATRERSGHRTGWVLR